MSLLQLRVSALFRRVFAPMFAVSHGSGEYGSEASLDGSQWPGRLQFGGPARFDRAAEREAAVLILICFLDTITTLWWVATGRATEANPLLQWTFHYHPVVFVLVKLVSFIPACWLALRLAQRYPEFTVGLMRLVSIAYLLLYFGNLFAA